MITFCQDRLGQYGFWLATRLSIPTAPATRTRQMIIPAENTRFMSSPARLRLRDTNSDPGEVFHVVRERAMNYFTGWAGNSLVSDPGRSIRLATRSRSFQPWVSVETLVVIVPSLIIRNLHLEKILQL